MQDAVHSATPVETKDVRFSVVIATLDRVDLLRETLESLRGCDPYPAEVIVLDGDPGSSAQETVHGFEHRLAPALRYIHTLPSLTAQRNRGIDEGTGDVVVFFDDDVELSPDVFGELEDAYRDESVVGATGLVVEQEPRRLGGPRSLLRRLLPGGGREGTFTRFGYPRYLRRRDRPLDVEFMQGCFMSARRSALEQVRFDEKMAGYALAEDEDFSYRLSRLGRIRYLPTAVVHHKKLGFRSKDTREFDRLVVVNRAYLFRKNFRQTPLARAQFGLLVAALVAHRLANRELRGALGLLEGAREAWLSRS
jgi:GT2 family glycosyltransferase